MKRLSMVMMVLGLMYGGQVMSSESTPICTDLASCRAKCEDLLLNNSGVIKDEKVQRYRSRATGKEDGINSLKRHNSHAYNRFLAGFKSCTDRADEFVAKAGTGTDQEKMDNYHACATIRQKVLDDFWTEMYNSSLLTEDEKKGRVRYQDPTSCRACSSGTCAKGDASPDATWYSPATKKRRAEEAQIASADRAKRQRSEDDAASQEQINKRKELCANVAVVPAAKKADCENKATTCTTGAKCSKWIECVEALSKFKGKVANDLGVACPSAERSARKAIEDFASDSRSSEKFIMCVTKAKAGGAECSKSEGTGLGKLFK